MPEQFTQDRTEAPTPRRREEARRKGQVAQSTDLTTAALLLAGAGALWLFSGHLAETILYIFRAELSANHDEWTSQHTVTMVASMLGRLGAVVMPMIVLLFVTASGVTAGQVGPHVSFEPMGMDWSKLAITKGWSRLLSFRSAMRGLMLVLKASFTTLILLWLLRSQQDRLVIIGRQRLEQSLANTWNMSLLIAATAGGVLLALGLLDYWFQRWQHGRDLMMSRQEVRDEHKQEEGDPQVKARLRRLQRETVKNQMIQNVPDATVVLTNPTHYAVALRYDRESMEAPRVVAKGTDAFARRIVRVARENGVPVLERKPLARALYASVEVDQEIPPALYKAIAEILAHIYRMSRST
jgi:flagellar biosynthetic protein FlhB